MVFMVPAAIILGAAGGGLSVVVAGFLFAVGCWSATFLAVRHMAGLVYVADQLLRGRTATYTDGMAAVTGHSGPLGAWALITVAVGWLLRAVEGGGDSNVVVTILRVVASSLLAAAWSLVTFFVLPVMILEGTGTVAAMKRSVSLIRDRWGEAVVGTFRIGLRLALVFVLPGVLMVVAGVALAAAGGGAEVAAGGLCLVAGAGLIVVWDWCCRQRRGRSSGWPCIATRLTCSSLGPSPRPSWPKRCAPRARSGEP